MSNTQHRLTGVIDHDIIQIGQKMMTSLETGAIKRQQLTNTAKPYGEKAVVLYSGLKSFLKTKNYSYILFCEGVDECII